MIYRNPNLIQRSQELRKRTSLTDEEKILWYKYLHEYSPHFRRQYVVKNYILDFYCPTAKLAVELDGSQHFTDEGLAYDTERTAVIESYGIRVIRFTNLEIHRNLDAVCTEIDMQVKMRLKRNSD